MRDELLAALERLLQTEEQVPVPKWEYALPGQGTARWPCGAWWGLGGGGGPDHGGLGGPWEGIGSILSVTGSL